MDSAANPMLDYVYEGCIGMHSFTDADAEALQTLTVP